MLSLDHLPFATNSHRPHRRRRPPPSTVLQLHRRISFAGSRGCEPRRHAPSILVLDDDWTAISPFLEGDGVAAQGSADVASSSSEGEESDVEMLPAVADVELPVRKERLDGETESALAAAAHRFATLRGHTRGGRGFSPGFVINLGLFSFLFIFMLLVDWWSWRIIRQPLQPFYLSRPFLIAFALSACAGYLYVPLFQSMRLFQIIRKIPASHATKRGIPTIGGLFFIPIGVIVARATAGYDSVEVNGAVIVTLAFAAIGFLDDMLSFLRNHNDGLPGFAKFIFQATVGVCFCFWLDSTNISSPYSMKFLVPLPVPLGLVYLGRFYHALTAFCFVSMGNGINLTDGLDGLAGGVAALTLSGMCVAVLPICPDLAVFGASMAGTCAGFLCHNRYKASVFMGNTGSLALGGALSAMAACTGMYFPLFVSSGIFVVEALSVVVQVVFLRATKCLLGSGTATTRMAPFHHHLELQGLKEPDIVVASYLISCILALYAGYVGLISA